MVIVAIKSAISMAGVDVGDLLLMANRLFG
jgi:hypothetical protein